MGWTGLGDFLNDAFNNDGMFNGEPVGHGGGFLDATNGDGMFNGVPVGHGGGLLDAINGDGYFNGRPVGHGGGLLDAINGDGMFNGRPVGSSGLYVIGNNHQIDGLIYSSIAQSIVNIKSLYPNTKITVALELPPSMQPLINDLANGMSIQTAISKYDYTPVDIADLKSLVTTATSNGVSIIAADVVSKDGLLVDRLNQDYKVFDYLNSKGAFNGGIVIAQQGIGHLAGSNTTGLDDIAKLNGITVESINTLSSYFSNEYINAMTSYLGISVAEATKEIGKSFISIAKSGLKDTIIYNEVTYTNLNTLINDIKTDFGLTQQEVDRIAPLSESLKQASSVQSGATLSASEVITLIDSKAMLGTFKNDTIIGKTGNDTIWAGAGHDTVKAWSGNDVIYGEAGNDIIFAGLGNDTVHGGTGNDEVYGGDGHDKLYGNDGNDFLYGHEGNDTIFGGTGNDTVHGNNGHDTLYGDSGDDLIAGQDGNDKLYGGTGNDIISGGVGNDTAYGDDGNDGIYLQDGNDSAWGGRGADILSGGIGDDTLYGGDGFDTLNGGAGNDKLYGENGNDMLYMTRGSILAADKDLMNGGSGKDTVVFDSVFKNVIVDFVQNNLNVDALIKSNFGGVTSIKDIEVLQFNDGAYLVSDLLKLAQTGNTSDNIIM